MLKLGLLLGGLAFLWVSWASWSAGYPPEIASVRGLFAFMAMAVVGYVGELIVATAEPRSPAAADGAPAERAEPAAAESPPAAQLPEPAAPSVALPQTGGALPELPAPVLGVPEAQGAPAEELAA